MDVLSEELLQMYSSYVKPAFSNKNSMHKYTYVPTDALKGN
jgi:hypothetical protein